MKTRVPIFPGTVTETAVHFLPVHVKLRRAYFKSLEGEPVEIVVRRKRRPQTGNLRRYYRGIVIPEIAEQMGEADLELVHDAVAWKFLRIEDHPITGAPRRRSTSNGDMSHDEMSAYVDRVILWAETFWPGLHIPRPHEAEAA